MRLGQTKLISCFMDFFPCKPDQAGSFNLIKKIKLGPLTTFYPVTMVRSWRQLPTSIPAPPLRCLVSPRPLYQPSRGSPCIFGRDLHAPRLVARLVTPFSTWKSCNIAVSTTRWLIDPPTKFIYYLLRWKF